MNKYHRINLSVLIFFIAFTKVALATLELELTQGIDSALPIAVPSFIFQGPIANNAVNNIHEVVKNDLKNSGHFHLIEATDSNFKSKTLENLDYDYWRSQKVNSVIIGSVSNETNNRYKVTIELHDVYGRTILLDKQFIASSSELRSLAHHISDLVYEKLLGISGIFSTKICYILVERHPGNSIKYKLEIADADGFNPRTLLTSNQPIMSPAWSPDGKYIAYVSFENNRSTIYKQEIITGKREFITRFPGINGAPAWSPDGKKMALVLTKTDEPKIYILDLLSNKLTQLTTGWSLDTEPAWAPDGQSLLFTSNRSGGPQIYKINLADKEIQRLTYEGNYNARASFSKDGKNLVMLHQEGDAFTIAVQDLSSGRLLTLTRSEFDESPSLSPNGNMVVYATNYHGRGVLAEVSLDGRVKLRLPEQNGEVQEPAWSP